MAQVTDNIDKQRFELAGSDGIVAAVYYRLENDLVVLIHTEVPFAVSGQGFGTALAQGVFALLRETGRRASVRCDFMGRFVARHPEVRDVLAR